MSGNSPTRFFLLGITVFSGLRLSLVRGEIKGLLCEWGKNPLAVKDPCPEFFWEVEEQTAYRLFVGRMASGVKVGKNRVWDSGKTETSLSIAEYGGPPLEDGATYFWTVHVWFKSGPSAMSPVGRFRVRLAPPTYLRPHTGAFLNFGSPQNARLIANRYDYTFRKELKNFRQGITTINYALLATMMVPSAKAKALSSFCISKGLAREGFDDEEVFLGRRSARIDESDSTSFAIKRQYVELEPRTSYTVGGRIKTREVKRQGAQLYAYEFKGGELGGIPVSLRGTNDWNEYRFCFRTVEGRRGCINFRIMRGTGTAWFDEIKLVKGTYPKITIFIREFEKATVFARPGGTRAAVNMPPARIALQRPARPLRANGSLSDRQEEILLRPGEGAIMIRP